MKRFVFLLGVILSLTVLFADKASSQVMFVGTKMVSFKGGIPYRSTPFYTNGSFVAGVEYGQFLKGGDYWSVGIDAELNKVPKKEFFIQDLSLTANGGYNLFIIGDFARRFNLYGYAGATLGYELFNNGEATLTDGDVLARTQAFIYGGKVGLHSDIYVSNQIALNLGLGTNFLWGTVTNTVVRPYFTGGVKISFY